jgi:hypothetical protein
VQLALSPFTARAWPQLRAAAQALAAKNEQQLHTPAFEKWAARLT